MTDEELKYALQICEAGENMYRAGFVSASDGNISVRLSDGCFLTTPSGVSKGKLKPEMLVKMDAENSIVYCPDGYKPSSEFKMHLRCYLERPEVMAVVHAHPPVSTSFAVMGIPLDSYCISESIMFLGSVPVAPYATPGTEEVPESIVPFLPYHDAILLSNHGALTMGATVEQAYFKMETLEQVAKIMLNTRILGGAEDLPMDKIDACCKLGEKYTLRHPGYRKYS